MADTFHQVYIQLIFAVKGIGVNLSIDCSEILLII
jgi:hypothetical protein